MGRVARYKKIKSFDPYSKQNAGRMNLEHVGIWGMGDLGRKPKKQSRTVEKLRASRIKRTKGVDAATTTTSVRKDRNNFDVPPSTGDDFDLSDLTGSLKKDKQPLTTISDHDVHLRCSRIEAKAAVKVAFMPNPSVAQAALEDRKIAKILKLDDQVDVGGTSTNRTQATTPIMERLPGESRAAFYRRLQSDTNQFIKRHEAELRNPEKVQRKKEFLNNKKKRKKNHGIAASTAQQQNRRSASNDEDDDIIDDDDDMVPAEKVIAARAQQTQVAFGEQAERPPTFRVLPRGGIPNNKKNNKNTPSMMTGNKRGFPNDHEDDDDDNNVYPRSKRHFIKANDQDMELMRRKIQAQYAAIKLKRKQAGDFHL